MTVTARTPSFVSIRTKLATATVLLIAAISTAGYFGLSEHEKRSQISGKTTAATMMAGLFNASVSAALAFDDAKEVKEQLKNLGRNDEVLAAAVFSLDPEDPKSLGNKLGEFQTGSSSAFSLAPPKDIPQATRTVRSADWVLVEAPVRDPSGSVSGVTQITFSLAKENAAIRLVERRLLGMFATFAIGLSVLLLGLAQLIIVRPVRKLSSAAERLEKGECRPGTAAFIAKEMAQDEIGALARTFESMSRAIELREQQISARNHDMRLVLDNVEEGFLTVDLQGVIAEERSAIIDRWFGAPISNNIVDYIRQVDGALGLRFGVAWEAVVEDIMPLELTIEQLPRGFERDGRSFELQYRPIFDQQQQEAKLSRVLLMVTDVTARVARERAEISQREMAAIFERVITDRAGFDEFFAEASALVAAISDPQSPAEEAEDSKTLRRRIHTLKGNVGFFGLERVATMCHELESSEGPDNAMSLTVDDRDALRKLWDEVAQMAKRFARSESSMEIRSSDYEELLNELRAGADPRSIVAIVQSWRHEPVETRFARIAEQVQGLATRLGRGEVKVTWASGSAGRSLRLPLERWTPFWSSLTHIVRNIVDHGIEGTEERAAAGKEPTPTIKLSAQQVGSELRLKVSDDGRGIDWSKIARRAAEKGLPGDTQRDLEEALYADGVSTRDQADEISGRGVGMGAVREAVRSLGGRIELTSVEGEGTSFEFVFPKSLMFEDRIASTTSIPPRSLRLASAS
jgi:two-component system, chemotaxis family, sensor kinase CheA